MGERGRQPRITRVALLIKGEVLMRARKRSRSMMRVRRISVPMPRLKSLQMKI